LRARRALRRASMAARASCFASCAFLFVDFGALAGDGDAALGAGDARAGEGVGAYFCSSRAKSASSLPRYLARMASTSFTCVEINRCVGC
jgi:hypothetical protein